MMILLVSSSSCPGMFHPPLCLTKTPAPCWMNLGESHVESLNMLNPFCPGGSCRIVAGQGLLLQQHITVECSCQGSFVLVSVAARVEAGQNHHPKSSHGDPSSAGYRYRWSIFFSNQFCEFMIF